MNNWVYIDSINSMPTVQFVNCDTRDFNIITDDEPIQEQLEKRDKAAIQTYRNRLRGEDYIFRQDEILGTLKTLEMNTGGPGEWRMITLKNKTAQVWVKYIEFWALPETIEMFGETKQLYMCITRDAGRFTQLGRTDLRDENIDKHYLNHIGPND